MLSNNYAEQLQQCDQMIQQLMQQTQQASQLYQQMIQQEQQNAQQLQQLAQREQQAVHSLQHTLQGHQSAMQQMQQLSSICRQLEHGIHSQISNTASQNLYGMQSPSTTNTLQAINTGTSSSHTNSGMQNRGYQ